MTDYKAQAGDTRRVKQEAMGAQSQPVRYDLTSPDGLRAAQDKLSGLGLNIKLTPPKGTSNAD